jgi:two-component system, chemotaxis family, chemotaxis protein CheV
MKTPSTIRSAGTALPRKGDRRAEAARLEILLFTLGADPATGRNETYGIDVFRVREVLRAPAITRTPDTRLPVTGMISLRGALVPVIDLAKCAGLPQRDRDPVMILTESDGRTQGLLVEAVDSILRIDAVAALDDGRLILMIGVENVLAHGTAGRAAEIRDAAIEPPRMSGETVLGAGRSNRVATAAP